MPIYDFRCENCGHRFTVLVGIRDRDKVRCPRCQSGHVRQLVTGCGVWVRDNGCGGSGTGFRIKGG